MVRRAVLVVLSMIGVLLVWPTPAHAAYAVSLVGSTATLNGTSGFDTLTIDVSGGLLTHDGSIDWDAAGGDQTLANVAGSSVIINAGDGVDVVTIGTAGVDLAANIGIDGAGGADFVFTYPGDSGPDGVTITGNTLAWPGGGLVSWSAATDQVNVYLGGGNDDALVDGAATSPQVLVYGSEGDDSISLQNGASLGSDGAFRGGPGIDTLDYSGVSVPVSVDLGKTATFEADLDGASAVPPNANTATADASVMFTDLSTNTFDWEVYVDGLTSAEITGADIHEGSVGSNGAAVFPIGAGATWVEPDLPVGTNPATYANGATDPDITEPALRAGATYVDVHSAAGDIRGQLLLDPDDGYGGTATSIARVYTVENVIGGSGNDTFKGSVPANVFTCGGGQDSVVTGPGDTQTGCETVNGVTQQPPASPKGTISKLKPKATAKGAKIAIDTGATASCPSGATATCAVTATATAKIGKKTVTLAKLKKGKAAKGKGLKVLLNVSKKNATVWRGEGKVKITFTITISVPGGTGATVTKAFKIKPPKAG